MAAPANGAGLSSASQAPLHRNTTLAPSQELAYRSKCIELRRRLAEIEKQNDETRKRIYRERKAQDKMRLNRAILLHHLKDMVEHGKRLSPEQLQALASRTDETNGHNETGRLTGGSDGTEEEEIEEVRRINLPTVGLDHQR